MKVRLDKNDPKYHERLAELREIAVQTGLHPRGVFYFNTFEEFNTFKDIFKKAPTAPPDDGVVTEPTNK